tara:strand:+ start:1608 stop:1892 length:285 start_codon:yes stop_codon:yes gene_type:complete
LGLRLKKGEQLDWWWSMYDMPSLWPVVVGDGVDVPRMYHETANVSPREGEVSGPSSLNQSKPETRTKISNTAVRLFFPNPFKKKRKKQQEIPPT